MLQDVPLAIETCCARVSSSSTGGGGLSELSHDLERDGTQRTSPELFHISVILLRALAIFIICFNLARLWMSQLWTFKRKPGGGAVYFNLLDLAAAFVDSENTVRLSPSLGFSLFERALLFTWLSLQKSPLDRMLLLRQQTHEKRNLCKTSRYLSRVFRQNVSFSMISGSFKYGLTLTQ